jgi:gluconokinase
VVVMGVSGSGKSTVGVLLAADLGVPFADADDLHSVDARAKMAAGQPLDDEDRAPWLARCADWLAAHRTGAVLACSALTRDYRDRLRVGNPELCFLHLAGSPSVVAERVGERADRGGHFMPARLVGSQFDLLQPLQHDEVGVAISVDLSPAAIVADFAGWARTATF